jgi:hypothetical protein
MSTFPSECDCQTGHICDYHAEQQDIKGAVFYESLSTELVDIYTPEWIRVWLTVSTDSGLEFEEVGNAQLGEPPDWFDLDVRESGWDSVLGAQWAPDWSTGLAWCLENGIAPDQPFCVFLPTPHWSKCGYEYEEWDCEYSPKIVQKGPVESLAWVADVIEQAVRDEHACRRHAQERQTALTTLQRMNVRAMFVQFETYFTPGQSSYNDMEMPAGVRYVLCSSAKLADGFGGHGQLVSGENHEGNNEKAMDTLVRAAMKALPGLSEKTIRTLPKRRYGL